MSIEPLPTKINYTELGLVFVGCLLVFAYFSFYFLEIGEKYGTYKASNDYYFHLEKAKGKCYWKYNQETCNTYPRLYHEVIGVLGLANEETVFLITNLLILLLVFPILLYIWTKHIAAVLVYFSLSFAYQTIYAGTFPAAIVIMLLLWNLINRGLLKKIASVTIAIALHSEGKLAFFYVFVLAGLVDLILLLYKSRNNPTIKKFIDGLPKYPALLLKPSVFLDAPIDHLFKSFPVPFIYYTIKQLFKEKTIFWAYFAVFFVGSFVDGRLFWYLGLLSTVLIPKQYDDMEPEIKAGFLLLCFAMIAFNLVYWPEKYLEEAVAVAIGAFSV